MSTHKYNNGKAGMSQRGVIIYCGFLLTISGFSTDVMLPAFLPMAQDLNAPLSWVQATIPAFMFPFAIGQVIYGPASDRFGRRPVIAFGLCIFLIGAVIAALGQDISTVLTGRAIQGFGAASGPVIARAILRDTHSGENLAKAMAVAMGIFAIGPILAPLLGYSIAVASSWRFIFFAMGALVLVLLLIDWRIFRETNVHRDPHALEPQKLFSAVKNVLSNWQSRTFLILATAAYCALLSFVANGPLIYHTAFGISGLEFAILFAITGLGIVVGQVGNRLLLPRMGVLNTLRLASFVLMFASIGSTGLAMLDSLTPATFTVLMFAFNTSFLVVVSNTLTLIIDPHPRIAGLVSAFFGFVTITASALFVSITFELFSGDMVRWGLGMSLATGISFVGFMLVRQERISLAKH